MFDRHTVYCHWYLLPEYKPEDSLKFIPDMFVVGINVAEKREKILILPLYSISRKNLDLQNRTQNAKY
jgi:hypothetical protein